MLWFPYENRLRRLRLRGHGRVLRFVRWCSGQNLRFGNSMKHEYMFICAEIADALDRPNWFPGLESVDRIKPSFKHSDDPAPFSG